MSKVKTKVVVLEGETTMSNKELAKYLQQLLAGEIEGNSANFLLTQKPKPQEVKSPNVRL